MWSIWILTVCVFLQSFQETKWELKKKVGLEGRSLNADSQENLYCLSELGKVARYDSTLVNTAQFSLNLLNTPSYIETWNRLNVMLFYKESQQIIFLDRFLQLRNEYRLQDFQNAYFTAVATSANGTLWAFDSSSLRLLRLSPQNGEVLFDWFLNDLDYYPEVIFLREFENFLFALDANKGILIFDFLGNLLMTIEQEAIQAIGFNKGECYFLSADGNQLNIISLSDFSKVTSLRLPQNAKSVVYLGEKLYLLNLSNELCYYNKSY